MTDKKMKLILGTMTIGEQVFGPDVRTMIETFLDAGYRELDSAYVYNEGACERLLGDALTELPDRGISLATKVNPRITGRLDRQAVLSQFNESLACLRTDHVDLLYLHFPDSETPLEESLEACWELHAQGRFTELGLSNFPAWMVAEVCHICRREGWMLPRVYQGLYNPLSRHAERELAGALDYYGMRFYAYNPLAGGILTGKYEKGKEEMKEGRFTNRPNYQNRYWKESYFRASEIIRQAALEYNIGIVEATYRWLGYHSMLNQGQGDGIIIGASRTEQLIQNMNALNEGELPDKVLQAFEEAWELCRPDAPEYFRFYKAPKKDGGSK